MYKCYNGYTNEMQHQQREATKMKRLAIILTLGLCVILMSCKQSISMNTNIVNLTSTPIATPVVQSKIKIDSSVIANKLISKRINRLVFFDKDTFSIPFKKK